MLVIHEALHPRGLAENPAHMENTGRIVEQRR